MQTAIVSGATGLVGRHLVEYLCTQQVKVFALTRTPVCSGITDDWAAWGVTEVVLSQDSGESVERVLVGRLGKLTERTVFYHAAWGGESSLTDGGIEKQMENVSFVAECLDAARAIGCSTFVNIGSAQETFLEEELLATSEISQSDYAIAKIASRDIARMLGYLYKLDVIHTTLSVPIDPTLRRGGFIAKMLRKIVEGQPTEVVNSMQPFDLILLPDVSRALYTIGLRAQNCSQYYIGHGQFKTLHEHFNEFRAGLLVKPGQQTRVIPNERLNPQKLENDLGFRAMLDIQSLHESAK